MPTFRNVFAIRALVIAISIGALFYSGFSQADAGQCIEDKKQTLEAAKAIKRQKQEDATSMEQSQSSVKPYEAPWHKYLRQLTRPIASSNSGTFQFSYAIYPAKGKSPEGAKPNHRPTIIFIGGGPGHPDIDGGRNSKIPDGYDVIRLDQRGTGLNKNLAVQDFNSSFSSVQTGGPLDSKDCFEKLVPATFSSRTNDFQSSIDSCLASPPPDPFAPPAVAK